MQNSLQTRFRKQIFDRPVPLLLLIALMWGGNTVAGRLAVGEMSPMVVTALRWLITFLVLMAFAHRRMRVEWPGLRPHWKYFILMALSGFTIFNSLYYYAAHRTSGLNLSILQSGIPIFVLIGAWLWRGIPIRGVQLLGIFLSVLGILVVASHGDFSALSELGFNIGDLMVLVAGVFSAMYTLALKDRPAASAMSFFIVLALAAFLTSLPLLAIEYASGLMQLPTPKGWLILSYIAIFPSMIAQIFFIRSVELIGPGRAGIFVNLVPVFGALLSVLILREQLGLYHALSLALALGGIFIAERGKVGS